MRWTTSGRRLPCGRRYAITWSKIDGAPPRRSRGTASRPAGLSSTMSASSSKTMRRSPAIAGRRGRARCPDGPSRRARGRRPQAAGAAASRGASTVLTNTLPRSSATDARRRDPSRSGLGEELVEPQALLIGTDDPFHLLEFRAGAHPQTRRGDRRARRRLFPTCSRQFTGFRHRARSAVPRSGIRTPT